jgi:hypothetical protein
MTKDALQLEDFVVTEILRLAKDGQAITERLIDEAIGEMSALFANRISITAEDRKNIRGRLLARYLVTMELGISISSEHVPWIGEARRAGEISNDYWGRYQTYLRQSLSDAVVRALDLSTERIVDFFGNPLSNAPFQRRGLIMGDVQSGKTGNYIGICCKAADAGYRLIILLTGTIEHLRKQTQVRLDEGFVGYETGRTHAEARRPCGVGLVDSRPQVQVLTTTDSDFTIDLASQAHIHLDGAAIPTLLVTKKNQHNLGNIIKWISQMLPKAGKLSAPMLVIDDEADNASVNTSASDDPNKINGQIRELLELGQRSTYVGITATPFANAFMRHDSVHSMLGDDLFPRDFIYSLAPPSNYIGATRLFGDVGNAGQSHQYRLNSVDDAESWLPLKHKIHADVGDLPHSMKVAICRFVVAVAIRDIRGKERDSARSMMVNVSRFTGVQNEVQSRISDFVRSMKRDVEAYGNSPDNFATLENAKTLRAAYEDIRKHCAEIDPNASIPDWETVRAELTVTLVTRGIFVNALNSASGVTNLSFKSGERRIVVGGNSLSRGVTLSGLCVSYFYRKPLAKDTLLQMGRWFGYRDDYEDLCALFISDDARELYADASDTSDELRDLVSTMNDSGMTPRDFGLRVLHHPGRLAITARNKMRHAAEFEATISFSGILVETRRMNLRDAPSNFELVTQFCKSLETEWRHDRDSDSWVATKIPKQRIAELVEQFKFHSEMFAFQPTPGGRSPAAQMIRDAEVETHLPGHEAVDLGHWDIVIRGGEETPIEVAGVPEPIHSRNRFCTLSSTSTTLLISGQRSRLGDRVDECTGVNVADRRALEQSAKGKNLSGKQYRELRSRKIGRPLLVISFVKPHLEPADARVPPFVVGIGLSFPFFNDFGMRNTVHYRINTVEQDRRDEFRDEDEDGIAQ